MRSITARNLKGVFASCVIPFDSKGALNLNQLKKLQRFITTRSSSPTRVCFANPAITELHALSDKERKDLFAIMLEEANGAIIGAQGAIDPTVDGQIRLGKEAGSMGVHLLKFVPPVQTRPANGREAVAAVSLILEGVDIPCLFYNTTAFGGTKLTADDVVHLHDSFPNLIAFETGELPDLAYVKNETRSQISCAAISEASGLMSMSLGSDGYFSGNPVILEASLRMHADCARGEFLRARNYYLRNRDFFSLGNFPYPPTEPQPVTAKYCLSLLGISVGRTRPPLKYPPTSEHRQIYSRVLDQHKKDVRGLVSFFDSKD